MEPRADALRGGDQRGAIAGAAELIDLGRQLADVGRLARRVLDLGLSRLSTGSPTSAPGRRRAATGGRTVPVQPMSGVRVLGARCKGCKD
jgi:hypothetical protein